MKLIATKSMSYNTRRLKAGDEFEATNMHGRILMAGKRAKPAPDREEKPARAPRKAAAVQPQPETQQQLIPAERAAEPAQGRYVGAMATVKKDQSE